MSRDIELLAPAGNIESFKAAINAGADAIYMGVGKYNARAMAQNFTVEDYLNCLDYAHIRGVKIYLTLNTLVEDNDIVEILDMLSKLYEYGLDAVIIQDIGLASIIHRVFPDLHLHASTQMSVYSLEQVKFLEELGFKRVVLARELTLDEISYISNNTKLEIEVFIHGALCVSVSGQCLMSLSIGNRSANKGKCAQPCRMKYTLCESSGKKLEETYFLSKKDIYGLDILKELINSNIASLKIEGRNKTPEYVAYVVSRYRKYIDLLYRNRQKTKIEESDQKNLLQIFNRSGKSYGYLKGIEHKNSITTMSPKNTGLYLGDVLDKKGCYIKIRLKEDIDLHDGIEIYGNDIKVSTIVTSIKDINFKENNSLVKSDNIVYLGDIKENVCISDKVFKTSSNTLNTQIKNMYLNKNNRKRKLELNVIIKENNTIKLIYEVNGKEFIYDTLIVPEKSKTKPIDDHMIEQIFSKTQDNGIEFSKIYSQIDNGLFAKVASLNEVRRNFIKKLEEKYCVRRHINKNDIYKVLNRKISVHTKNIKCKNILSIYSYDKSKDYIKYYEEKYHKTLERIDFQVQDYLKYQNDILDKYSSYNLGINLSNFTLENTNKYIEQNLEYLIQKGVKFVIIGSYRYINFLRELKKKYKFYIVADYGLNINNTYSADFASSLGIDIIVPDFDCSNQQIKDISNYFNIELVDDYITVMTSRYCVLGTFIGRNDNKCSMPCQNKKYYLLDKYNKKYNIVTNNVDCIMSIIKDNNLNNTNINCYIRNTIL